MEQGVVMIPMYHTNGTHCGLARIRYMGNFVQVDVRWSGRPRNDLELVLLTEDGLRTVRNGRAPLGYGRRLYGIAAINDQGNCVCCGALRGEERAFAQSMLLLRLGFPTPRPQPPFDGRDRDRDWDRDRDRDWDRDWDRDRDRGRDRDRDRDDRDRGRDRGRDDGRGGRILIPGLPPLPILGRQSLADQGAEEAEVFAPAMYNEADEQQAYEVFEPEAQSGSFGPAVRPLSEEEGAAILSPSGRMSEEDLPGVDPGARLRPQGYIYGGHVSETTQYAAGSVPNAVETFSAAQGNWTNQSAQRYDAPAQPTFFERAAPPAQRTRPVKEQPPAPVRVQPPAPARVEQPPASARVEQPPAPMRVKEQPPAPVRVQPPAPARVKEQPPAPVRVQPPAPARVKEQPPAPARVKEQPPAPVRVKEQPVAPPRPAPVVPPAPPAPARPAPIPAPAPAPCPPCPVPPPCPAPTPCPPCPAPTPCPPCPAPAPCPEPPPCPTPPPCPAPAPCPEPPPCPAPKAQAKPMQIICVPSVLGESRAKPCPPSGLRCDTTQDICRSPGARFGSDCRLGDTCSFNDGRSDCRLGDTCFSNDGEEESFPVSAQPYISAQFQPIQPGVGAMPQAPSMQPIVPPAQATQPGVSAPMQPGAMPQAPFMQPTVRPPAQAIQPGVSAPMQPGAMPQAPSMQPTVRPPAQTIQPGVGTMPQTPSTQPMRPPTPATQPGFGTPMPQAPSMQPTVRPPMQAAQPGMSMPVQPGIGTMPQTPMQPMRPPMPITQPGMSAMPQTPSTQPARPPVQVTQPGFGMPAQPAPQSPATRPGAQAAPTFPSNAQSVRPMQPGPAFPQPGSAGTQPSMPGRAPAVQIPEMMQPAPRNGGIRQNGPAPSSPGATPNMNTQNSGIPRAQQGVPGSVTLEEVYDFEPAETPDLSMPPAMPPAMSPANSAALQQILEQANGVFPAQPGAANYAVPSSAPVRQSTARAARTTEEWQREVDELLQGSMPPAQATPNTAPESGGRRQSVQHPFPGQFPDSEWVRVETPNGDGYYYEGRMKRGNERFVIMAVPGEYRPIPPRHLQGQGFGRYIPSRNGGCWVRVQREQ